MAATPLQLGIYDCSSQMTQTVSLATSGALATCTFLTVPGQALAPALPSYPGAATTNSICRPDGE